MSSLVTESLDKEKKEENLSLLQIEKRGDLICQATNRQFIVLSSLAFILIGVLGVYYWIQHQETQLPSLPLLPLVFLSGIISGFMGIQRRLPIMKDDELKVLVSSWLATCLPSIYGSLLALILFVLFLTGILGGSLFPGFEIISTDGPTSGFDSIMNIQATSYQDVAKLVFWSFISGYSERFVPSAIDGIESRAGKAIDDRK